MFKKKVKNIIPIVTNKWKLVVKTENKTIVYKEKCKQFMCCL